LITGTSTSLFVFHYLSALLVPACCSACPAAAVAAERASLLDEIKRMVEQASASTEILNELILNKEQVGAGWGW
jgi:hypothetical protein